MARNVDLNAVGHDGRAVVTPAPGTCAATRFHVRFPGEPGFDVVHANVLSHALVEGHPGVVELASYFDEGRAGVRLTVDARPGCSAADVLAVVGAAAGDIGAVLALLRAHSMAAFQSQ